MEKELQYKECNEISTLEVAKKQLVNVEEELEKEYILLDMKYLEVKNINAGMNFLNTVQPKFPADDSFIEEELNKEERLLDMKRLEINNTNAGIDLLLSEKEMLESVIKEEEAKLGINSVTAFLDNDKQGEFIMNKQQDGTIILIPVNK